MAVAIRNLAQRTLIRLFNAGRTQERDFGAIRLTTARFIVQWGCTIVLFTPGCAESAKCSCRVARSSRHVSDRRRECDG